MMTPHFLRLTRRGLVLKQIMAAIAVIAVGLAPLAGARRSPETLGRFNAVMCSIVGSSLAASIAITLTVDDRSTRRALRRKLWIGMAAAYAVLLVYLLSHL